MASLRATEIRPASLAADVLRVFPPLIPLSAGTDKPVITVTTVRTASISIKLNAALAADREGFAICLAWPALRLRVCPWGERLNFELVNDMRLSCCRRIASGSSGQPIAG